MNQESGTPLKDSVPVIPEEAVEEPSFNRTLSLQNITFEIKESGDQLTIQPSGYEIVNSLVSKDITGLSVVNAEIEDLNSDGFPEILIYLTSDGSGSYGTVLAFSSNQNKSMSEISFPSVADNPNANKGYMGHDEFTVVETTLTHRFPIYNDGDSNSKPSGKMRQIQYKLKDGEASRVFVIDKIIEF
ncbi:MAG: PliI family lysozyme inhibitor of I-type lysozyme [Flavobacteriaceae bacterium]|nr:PliI family lysozyme inhibitor of I-type lysozyme [Flavobacteriaceae bacterium]